MMSYGYALLGLVLLLAVHMSISCTLIGVGRKATSDGSVMVAHTDDAGWGTADLRVVRVPAKHHKHGDKRYVYAFNIQYPRVVLHSDERGHEYAPEDHHQKHFKPLGHIPQVKHTYAYWDQDYGLTNEVGLSIAESTAGAKTVGFPLHSPGGHNLFDVSELSRVALERCDSARCAVELMGHLAVTHGFYNNGSGTAARPSYDGSAECLAIGDKHGEVWIFNIMTGENNRSAVWAAQRVPDGHIAAIANTFTIRTMDLKDKDHYLASDNVHSFAKKMGWWDGRREFDFTAAYAFADKSEERMLPDRRTWRIYDLVGQSFDPYLAFKPRANGFEWHPFSVAPKKPISVRWMHRILRDYYEDTPFDQTKGNAAGPFGNPVRWNANASVVGGGWERPISIFRATYSFVTQIRSHKHYPDALTAVMWYGLDAPHGTVYCPIYGGQSKLPKSYTTGMQSKVSLKSAWWAFSLMNNWVLISYNVMHPERVRNQKRLEDKAEAWVKEVDENKHHLHPQHWVEHAEKRSYDFAEEVVSEWWELVFKFMAKYNNGNVITGELVSDMNIPGYPEWWLKETDYFQKPKISKHIKPVAQPEPEFAPASAAATSEATRQVQRRAAPVLPDARSGSGVVEVMSSVSLVLFGAFGAVVILRLTDKRTMYNELP
uniref:Dipeptidase n=1 Tax=Eutreptiella gymnastica TaxID=73025 RepID=A0A7S1IXI8_9EUGL|mmetsp:Transcript_50979/g.91160  ORF Transcript_50979/g.91160 Transcript_50979/m.91160 type:complete len:657 (+) Transcript_50979:37-2007(+)